GLGSRQAAALLFDLSAAVILALVLSAPAIVAFAAFVPEASIGGHGDEFIGMVQQKVTSILYLFPYFYGNFVAASDEAVAGMSIGSGGYIAVAPVILAIGSLFAPGYRAVKVLLCAWIVVALGTSHGWPVIYPAFMSLPLMDLVVPGRYLNASWILCVIFLAAMMIDRLPQLDAAQRRRCMIGALAGIVLVATAAV